MKPTMILYGPQSGDVQVESFGKTIINSLKQENGARVALIDAHSGASLTYREILESSIKLACSFKQNGIKKNDIIAIISENNLNYIIPVLSAQYLGAIIQPVSPTWTLRELKHAFGIAKPKWVICSEAILNKVTELKGHFDCIQTIVSFGKEQSGVKSFQNLLKTNASLESFKPEHLDPVNQVAFVFSSSGTTGLPKGVMITHQNLVATMQYWRDERYGYYKKGDTTVSPIPLYHLFGMHMLLLSVISSMKLIMMNKFDPELYLKNIELHQVNQLACPPPLILFLTKSSLADTYDLSSLKNILCGSAPLQREVEANIGNRFNVKMRQTYATTETAGVCTMVPSNSQKSGSCGTLLPNLIAKVRDLHTKQILGPNQAGELCFKGPVVMKGYMNNPDATDDAFDEDGFYCTGDIGYYDEDKYFFIVGRIKELIKYKAFQVAPAELEDILLSHPAVRDAAVIGFPDERAGELPLAYVVKQPGQEISEKEIVAFISERVSPEKRLHGGVRFIDEIPKNAGGKILRQTLREISNNTRHQNLR